MLEEERLTGNFKFKVCDPSKSKLHALCPECINEDQIKSHRMKPHMPPPSTRPLTQRPVYTVKIDLSQSPNDEKSRLQH